MQIWRDARDAAVAVFRNRPYVISFLLVSAVCAFCMAFLDRPLSLYFETDANRTLIAVFRRVTELGDATPYIVACVAVIFVCRVASYFDVSSQTRLRLTRFMDAGVFVILAVAFSGIVINLMKAVFGRYRPEALFDDGLYGFSWFNLGYEVTSFPSGHSQTIWAVAMALILVYPRYDVLYIAVAVLVAFSRVVVGAHYLSDVIFGAYIAVVLTLVLKHRFHDRRGIAVRIGFERDHRILADVPPDTEAGRDPDDPARIAAESASENVVNLAPTDTADRKSS